MPGLNEFVEFESPGELKKARSGAGQRSNDKGFESLFVAYGTV
jgi:hypothetical protein